MPTYRAKKFYTEVAGVAAPLATFAGGLTLATQFIITCPDSRLEALLSLASQFFLASALGLFLIYMLLYGFEENVHIKNHRRKLVFTQLFLVAIFMCIAFILLAVAIMVAGRTDVGTLGIILMGIIVANFATIEISILCTHHGVNTTDLPNGPQEAKDLPCLTRWILWIGLGCELVVAFLMLGFGADAAADAHVQRGCTPASMTTYPWPTPVPVTIANQPVSAVLTSTPVPVNIANQPVEAVLKSTPISVCMARCEW
ncbi:hypothetical protein BDV36DRAFT_300956 [Aspergillus pseudocaelatus]|uniref:MARVEL domain-containing protein n=1 Tax=Aspergillus pseudocaelatus TaxID=1825620 RepID=A0ABQ6W5E8_9EURO|nr:hypothetical protein BDV36DRAFT_300956 [Aspergillus pseudocaelatus]